MEKGHQTRDCTKPRKEMSERGCFNCGGTGHQARNCPKKAGQARSLESPPPSQDQNSTWLGCFGDEEGFVPVTRGKAQLAAVRRSAAQRTAASRAPRGCTFGDCIPSVFLQHGEAMRKSEEHGASSLKSQPKAKFPEEEFIACGACEDSDDEADDDLGDDSGATEAPKRRRASPAVGAATGRPKRRR